MRRRAFGREPLHGQVAILAAKEFDARAIGVDRDPLRVAEATAQARAAGVADRATFVCGDLLATDVSLPHWPPEKAEIFRLDPMRAAHVYLWRARAAEGTTPA